MITKLRKSVMFASKQVLYLFVIQVTALQLLLAKPSSSQELDEITISIHVNKAELTEVFRVIKAQTGFAFSYSDNVLAGSPKVTMNYDSVSLKDVLDELSAKASLRFKRVNKNISVIKDLTKGRAPGKESEQNRQIQGNVTDKSTGEPLIGATVHIKRTNIGTITDVDGKFTLAVPDGAGVFVVSFVGFEKTEVIIGSQSVFDIALVPSSEALEEVVVIGYGTAEKTDLTGSVVSLGASEIGNQPNSGFEHNIAGRLPGVNIQQTTGTPGGNVSIRIRGTGSISAGNDPLIVIDGFPISDSYSSPTVQGSRPSNATRRENPQNTLSTLNPNDIESIEVLKDAAAAAIYGSRGANGVILITTKRGSEGKSKFSFNSYYGVQRITNTYEMMDAYTFAEQNYLARVNAGTTSGYPAELLPYLNDDPGLVNTDWQDALFRDAAIQHYDLSVSGGTKSLNYYVSGNFFSQDGIITGSGFERYSLRANVDGKISDKVKLSFSLNPSVVENDLVPAENPYFVDGVVNLALLSLPTEPIYNEDGSYNFRQNTLTSSGPFVNPIALANGLQDDLKQFRLLGNIKLEAELLDGLVFSTSFGGDFNNFRRHYYRPSWIPVRGASAPSNPEARNFTTSIFNWVNENTLSYALSSGDHQFNFLAGFTAQKEVMDRTGMYANNFPNDLVTTINAGTVTSGFSQIQEWSLLSYIGRVMYDYKGKYLVNASLRRDGSSRFGKDTKWGMFPSVSAGWRLSDEEFFPSSAFVSSVKLRASIGETGNFSIPNYGAIALLEAADYVLDNEPVNGLAPGTSPNPDLSWEKTVMSNFGLDLGLLDNRLTVNADYFISNTRGLLINLPVPGSSGFSRSLQNIGEVQNKGFELGITSEVTLGPVRWTANANIATLKNEVISLGKSNEPIISNGGVDNTHITRVGEPIGSYYGYHVLGVFRSPEELESYPHVSDAQVGDFKFEDVDGDNAITPGDRTIIGDFFPDYTFGFSSKFEYKGFDLSFLVQGSQHFEVLHLAQRYLSSLQTFSNYRADIYRNAFFTEEFPGNGKIHRPNGSPTGDNDAVSSYYVEDGSYVRIRNITLGYSFTGKAWKTPFHTLRVYAMTQNPFTFTKYPGYNPEVNVRPDDPLSQGEDYGTYPLAKSIVLGINLGF